MMETIAVTVKKNWMDGNLAEEFAEYGYPAKWRAGLVRKLPTSLVRKVEASGAEIAIPTEGAPEDFIIRSVPATILTEDQKEAIAADRFKSDLRVRVLCLKKWKDGNLMEQFAAIGRPPELWTNEIAVLPKSLLDVCLSSGLQATTQPDEIREFDNDHAQLKHQVRVLAWRKEHEAEKARAAQAQAEAPRLARIREQIEELSARLLKTNSGTKAREALEIRIDALYQELK